MSTKFIPGHVRDGARCANCRNDFDAHVRNGTGKCLFGPDVYHPMSVAEEEEYRFTQRTGEIMATLFPKGFPHVPT